MTQNVALLNRLRVNVQQLQLHIFTWPRIFNLVPLAIVDYVHLAGISHWSNHSLVSQSDLPLLDFTVDGQLALLIEGFIHNWEAERSLGAARGAGQIIE